MKGKSLRTGYNNRKNLATSQHRNRRGGANRFFDATEGSNPDTSPNRPFKVKGGLTSQNLEQLNGPNQKVSRATASSNSRTANRKPAGGLQINIKSAEPVVKGKTFIFKSSNRVDPAPEMKANEDTEMQYDGMEDQDPESNYSSDSNMRKKMQEIRAKVANEERNKKRTAQKAAEREIIQRAQALAQPKAKQVTARKKTEIQRYKSVGSLKDDFEYNAPQ